MKRGWRSEEGQALTETALLCFLILVAGAAADAVLRQPALLEAIDAYVRSYSFALSLPFP